MDKSGHGMKKQRGFESMEALPLKVLLIEGDAIK